MTHAKAPGRKETTRENFAPLRLGVMCPFSLALLAFSNGLALFLFITGFERQWFYVPLTLILLSATLWWARRTVGLSWAEIGFTHAGWQRSAIAGLLVGLVLAAPPLVFFAFPFLLANPVRYHEIGGLNTIGFVWRVGVEATLATALTEEAVFRGVLQALFKRSLNVTWGIVATNVVFALWHLATNAFTLTQNQIALPFVPSTAAQVIGYIGSLVTVAVGGILFSILRERTHHLAGSIVAHWATVALMTIVIFAQSKI